MPKLPDPYALASGSPRPSVGVNSVATPNIAARSAAPVLDEVRKMAEAEADRLDDIAAEEALNKLRKARMDLTYDGQKGFVNVRGGDVVARPVLQDFETSFGREADAIAAGIKSNRARQRYEQRRAQESIGFRHDLARHISTQVDAYAGETFKGSIETAAAALRADPANPAKYAVELDNTRRAVVKEAQRLGLRLDGDDPAAFKSFMQSNVGAIHYAGIDSLIDSKQTEVAKQRLEAAKQEMTAAQIDQLEAKLKGNSTFEAGNVLFAETREKGLSDPDAIAYINANAKDGDIAAAAKARHMEWVAAKNRDDLDNRGGLTLTFNEDVSENSRQKILTSQGFRKLDKSVQGDFDSWMLARIAGEERSRDEKIANDPAKLAIYDTLLNNPNWLAGTNNSDIEAYRPILGNILTRGLTAARREYQAEGRRSSVDRDLIDEAIKSTPGAAGKSAEHKQNAAALRATVDLQLLDWKERNPGKKISREEQVRLIENARKVYTEPRSFLGIPLGERKVPAYTLNPMPSDFERKAREYAAQHGKREPTFEEILDMWAKQPESRR